MFRKLLLGSLLIITTVMPTYATTTTPATEPHWVALDIAKARCVDFHTLFGIGVNTPADVAAILRSQGVIVDPHVSGSAADKVVVLNVTMPAGQQGHALFFNRASSCKLILSQEVKNGDITPPQELQ